MNRNVLIVLIGGFLVAVLVAVLVQASLGNGKKADASTPNAEILVAAKDMPLGHELVPGDLVWQQWPQSAVFSGAIVRSEGQKAEEALTGRLRSGVTSGQAIHPSMMVKDNKGNFMAASLKPGMRAVGVDVKADTMAGGFIGPGDYVDVILTYKVDVNNPDDNPVIDATVSKLASETILENVRVLAIDQEALRNEDQAKVARTVTLEVDGVGAERLALAAEMGDILLTLRGLGDETVMQSSTPTTDARVSRVMRDLVKLQGGGASNIVRVYNGNVIQNVPVRQNIEP